jgi:hypothetical protein
MPKTKTKKHPLESCMESSSPRQTFPLQQEDTQSNPLASQPSASATAEEVIPSALLLDMANEDQSPYCFTSSFFDFDLAEQSEPPSPKRHCSMMPPTHSVQPEDPCLPTFFGPNSSTFSQVHPIQLSVHPVRLPQVHPIRLSVHLVQPYPTHPVRLHKFIPNS